MDVRPHRTEKKNNHTVRHVWSAAETEPSLPSSMQTCMRDVVGNLVHGLLQPAVRLKRRLNVLGRKLQLDNGHGLVSRHITFGSQDTEALRVLLRVV